ncbi:general substrate transporter [Asimina triloba]
MAVGNVLGYAAGSFTHLHKLLPFASTSSCDVYCANLKTCFLLAIIFLLTLTTIALISVQETPPLPSTPPPMANESSDIYKAEQEPFLLGISNALRQLSRPMWILLLVTCLNWVAWFPFLLFDTDWMGKEVYGGKVGERLYDLGVRAGSFGLMFNSVVLGCTSLAIELAVHKVGVKRLWGCANFLLSLCLALTVVLTKVAASKRSGVPGTLPPESVRISAMALFSMFGIPLAVTYSVPFALASVFSNTSGAGQGD